METKIKMQWVANLNKNNNIENIWSVETSNCIIFKIRSFSTLWKQQVLKKLELQKAVKVNYTIRNSRRIIL